ncbi:hypothetical protein [Actinoallomurus rhizosphaericola]|uniref:hypothetical protein n=1 Tax=Actinoallomurus rhizosphaericola TaxID=2952536 RepID=UPI002093E534|nr:hypothetical protein [Actinoallomurus rhizosphaericola]MCO5998635.1 hypothetical protein [Actinoallomurus rhizosphaericola]
MIVRFVMALTVWLAVGVLIAAEGSAQAPPDYSFTVYYGVFVLAWTVSYWIRARSGRPRRWGRSEVAEAAVLVAERWRPRSRRRTRDDARPPKNGAGPPTARRVS